MYIYIEIASIYIDCALSCGIAAQRNADDDDDDEMMMMMLRMIIMMVVMMIMMKMIVPVLYVCQCAQTGHRAPSLHGC